MSELRQHLDSIRTEHRAAQYPGDLAAEVFGRGRPAVRRCLWGSASLSALAAAAAIGLVLMHHPATTAPPPASIVPGPVGSVASLGPIPLGPVPIGVPIDRAPSGALSLEFPARPASPAGLTLAPAFASPMAVAPSYTDLRMPTMPASPWSPGGGARPAPAGRHPATPPTSHPTRQLSQEAA